MKYRKKPVVVDAEQWFPGKRIEGCTLLADLPAGHPAFAVADKHLHANYDPKRVAWVPGLEGGYLAEPGDFIITGVKGERYPCKEDVFRATYEPAE
jgi:hypothetical protein